MRDGWVSQTEECGHRGSEDVGVEKTCAEAVAGEGECEVRGQCGFAYASFGGGYGDGVSDIWERALCRKAALGSGDGGWRWF